MDQVKEIYEKLSSSLNTVLIGQPDIVDQVVLCLFAGGHVLLEGVPGLGKTLLVNALARLVSGDTKRIQFTPDLMPSDILGTTVYRAETGAFSVKKGPVFTNLLLADEINRSPAKTQSALLQVMQEKEVTIDGKDYSMGGFFMCLATQNPIELEGTYPLPEAQLDRFLMKVLIEYPTLDTEENILKAYRNGFASDHMDSLGLKPLIDGKRLADLRKIIESVEVDDKIISYIAKVVETTRHFPGIETGASPRASVGLFQLARVQAAVQGRNFVIPDDVKHLVLPVVRHRIILDPEAEIEGKTADQFLRQILETVEVPR
jgi:MoxR-like ATPase